MWWEVWQSPVVQAKLNIEMKKVSMLENHAIISHETLETSSDYPETLTTIELRQYREQALLHISDRRMIMTFLCSVL